MREAIPPLLQYFFLKWCLINLMATGGSFPAAKRPGRGADHAPPSTAEVKECLELYLHSRNKSLWRGA
jgi:hypothetical protein